MNWIYSLFANTTIGLHYKVGTRCYYIVFWCLFDICPGNELLSKSMKWILKTMLNMNSFLISLSQDSVLKSNSQLLAILECCPGISTTVPIICYTHILSQVVRLSVICWQTKQVDDQFCGIDSDPLVRVRVDGGIVLLPSDDDGGAVIRWCLAIESHLF